jgi:hypothetical protein
MGHGSENWPLEGGRKLRPLWLRVHIKTVTLGRYDVANKHMRPAHPKALAWSSSLKCPHFLALEQERDHVVSLASATTATMMTGLAHVLYRFVVAPVLRWEK